MNQFLNFINQKCPKCGSGNIFHSNTYSKNTFDSMNKSCPNCGKDFMIEPGFYQGAMYFSYAFNVAILVIFGVLTDYFFDLEIITICVLVISISLILIPVNFRYSRILMLYFFGNNS